MHEYTLALLGGLMIGIAAVLLMAIHGHIMGVSGIASRLLPPTAPDWLWRVTFLSGILFAPVVAILFTGEFPRIDITGSTPLLMSGGLLVGLGTVIGNGCTSGHGVCGLSRFSSRSIIATSVFMAAAIATVFIVQQFVTG